MTAVALTIAGSDPSGGAGLQADIKTFHQHGVYGTSVVTLLTVQNTCGVAAVEVLGPDFVASQISAVVSDIPPAAAKTGALGSAEMIDCVARRAEQFKLPLVVDPVMISKHGDALIDQDATETLIKQLLPQAFLVTPNRHEAARLTGMQINDLASMEAAAAEIAELGPKHVLIKGGSHQSTPADVLFSSGQIRHFATEIIAGGHTHGTGCAFSAAITARLALGQHLFEAVAGAKAFVSEAIRTAPHLGSGIGPTNLHAPVEL